MREIAQTAVHPSLVIKRNVVCYNGMRFRIVCYLIAVEQLRKGRCSCPSWLVKLAMVTFDDVGFVGGLADLRRVFEEIREVASVIMPRSHDKWVRGALCRRRKSVSERPSFSSSPYTTHSLLNYGHDG